MRFCSFVFYQGSVASLKLSERRAPYRNVGLSEENLVNYALVIIENDPDKNQESNHKDLLEILNKAKDGRHTPSLQSASTFLFCLKTELVPFCKVVLASEECGHQTSVLFLDDKKVLISSNINGIAHTAESASAVAMMEETKKIFSDLL